MAIAGTSVAFAEPIITDLGVLSGASTSIGSGISADGQVVVGSSGGRAFRWTLAAGMQDLGLLPGASSAVARAVSADGTTVAGDCIVNGVSHGFRWTAGMGIHPIGAVADSSFPAVRAINGDGTIIVGSVYRDEVPLGLVGFRWTASGGLGPLLAGYYEVLPLGISADGQSVTGSFAYSDFFRPFRQVADGPVQNLGALPSETSDLIPGGWFAQATCISSDGDTIAGWSSSFGGAIKGFRWTMAGGMHELSPDNGRWARAISGDGNVIGGDGDWLWLQSTGMVTASTYLAAQGLDLSDWVLRNIYGLSSDGSSATGLGLFRGQNRAFLITGIGISPVGACCAGTVCSQTTAAACSGAFLGAGATCEFSSNPVTCCRANFNETGGLSVQDIFDFLAAYFASDPLADFNEQGGLSVQDIFDFLTAYFAGCP